MVSIMLEVGAAGSVTILTTKLIGSFFYISVNNK